MSLTPQQALRLSRAATLAGKHGTSHTWGNGERAQDAWVLEVEEVAALIDEATAAKDATIAALRKQLNDEIREGERSARDAYSEGNWAGRQEASGEY